MLTWIRALFLILFCFWSLGGSISFAREQASPGQQQRPVDLVWDIDWTLVYKAEPHTQGALHYAGEYYKLRPHSIEVLSRLAANPQIRLSLFSGGETSRNSFIAQYIEEQISLQTKKNFRFFKVLSKEHMELVSNEGKFSERFKKNLQIVPEFDLSRTLLVDDIANFTPESQRKNLLWLGPTYNYYPDMASVLTDQTTELNYKPKDGFQLQRDHDLLLYVENLIDKTLAPKNSNESFVDRIQRIYKNTGFLEGRWLCSRVF